MQYFENLDSDIAFAIALPNGQHQQKQLKGPNLLKAINSIFSYLGLQTNEALNFSLLKASVPIQNPLIFVMMFHVELRVLMGSSLLPKHARFPHEWRVPDESYLP